MSSTNAPFGERSGLARTRRRWLWRALAVAVLWIPISRLAWWSWAVTISPLPYPSTDMSRLEQVLPPPDAQLVRIYRGLPHQAYEPGALLHDLFLTQNTKIGRYRFYAEGSVPSPDSVERLSAAFRSPTMYQAYGGPALCGGYHPDLCYEWHSPKGASFTLVCLGCSGITLIGANGESLFCDLNGEAFSEVETIIYAPPAFPLRPHPSPRPNLHKLGEVDNPELVPFIVDDPRALPGIVVDETSAVLAGAWQYSTHTPPYVGLGYIHTLKRPQGDSWPKARLATATFKPDLTADGFYEVRLAHCANQRRVTNALVIVRHADGETQLRINQQEQPPHDRLFRTLGTFRFVAGTEGWVRISNVGTNENLVVIADAVQWLPLAK